MRRSILDIFLFLLVIISTAACNNDLPFDLKENPPKLVMNAIINADSTYNTLFLNLTGRNQIGQIKGAELGTIALLSNIMREIIALLCAPLLVKFFGKLAPISVGGATTMDTTLPIITRCSGQEFVIVSIFHGFIVDFSVPFLVTLFCSI